MKNSMCLSGNIICGFLFFVAAGSQAVTVSKVSGTNLPDEIRWKEIRYGVNAHGTTGYCQKPKDILNWLQGEEEYLDEIGQDPFLYTHLIRSTYQRISNTEPYDIRFSSGLSSSSSFLPIIDCYTTWGQRFGESSTTIIKTDSSNQYDAKSGLIYIESDASYFNDNHGPRIRSHITYKKNTSNGNLLLELLYLDNDGLWQALKSYNARQLSTAWQSMHMEAQVPYPTFVRFRLSSNDTIIVKIKEMSLFTQDCVADLHNLGTCL